MNLTTLYNQARNFSISKTNSGVITLSVSALVNELEFDEIIGSSIFFSGIELEVVSINTPNNSAYKTVTYSNQSIVETYDYVLQKSIDFRTVPENIINIQNYSAISTQNISSNDDPTIDVMVKPSMDIYGATGGWKTKEVLQEVVNTVSAYRSIHIPPIIDYNVSQFFVSAGTPLTAVINNLYPIPGLSISKLAEDIYVSIPSDESFSLSSIEDLFCRINSNSEQTREFKYNITGLPGEPINYVWADGDRTFTFSSDEFFGISAEIFFDRDDIPAILHDGSKSSVTLEFNRIGGVFGILKEESTSVSEQKWVSLHHTLDNLLEG